MKFEKGGESKVQRENIQGSYGHETSCNLKIHFPGLEKSWILRKMVKVMNRKVTDFHFSVQIFCAV